MAARRQVRRYLLPALVVVVGGWLWRAQVRVVEHLHVTAHTDPQQPGVVVLRYTHDVAWARMALGGRVVVCVARGPSRRALPPGPYLDEYLSFWDVEAGRLTGATWVDEWTTDHALSPDGRSLAWSSYDDQGKGILRVWDVATGRMARRGRVTQPVGAIAWSPDGERLVGELPDTDLFTSRWFGAWGPGTLALERRVRSALRYASSGSPMGEGFGGGITWSPDCHVLAVCEGDPASPRIPDTQSLSLCDVRTGALRRLQSARWTDAEAVAFSPDGARVVAVGTPVPPTGQTVPGYVPEIAVWDVPTGRQLARTGVPTGLPPGLFWSGGLLLETPPLFAGNDTIVCGTYMLDLRRPTPGLVPVVSGRAGLCVGAYSEREGLLLFQAKHERGVLELWDVCEGTLKRRWHGLGDVAAWDYSRHGDRLMALQVDGREVRVRRLE